MNQKLMREFEEFEGLGNQVVDESIVVDVSEEDDPSFRPTQAAALGSNEIYYEVGRVHMQSAAIDLHRSHSTFDTNRWTRGT